jgi:Suppressor of fused protein (SUFU)
MTRETLERQRALEAHLTGWFPHDWEAFSWQEGSIATRFPAFRVGRGRASHRSSWCYVTLGAWQATRDDHHALEYFILSPRPTAFHIETLVELTLQWADADPKPSLGSIIDTGRPWIDDAAADHFFVTLPYPFGPGFENVVHDDLHIQIMWLLPITKAEAAFIQQRGIDAFEQLAESSNVEFADPQRASLV